MTQILAERGIQLTKSLGQNFLHDANQLRRIADAAELSKADRVLEIGPGLGPLTTILLERSEQVLAIEKDARLVQALEQEFQSALEPTHPAGGGPRLTLLHADALEFLRTEHRDWSGWKVVSNLPYSVASPLLVELAALDSSPKRIVATLQIEVAKRLMAAPATPDYGLLTLLAQVAYEPRGWFKIPASCFFPQPDIDSACICMVRRESLHLTRKLKDTFVAVAKRSFSQRRKMMFKLLKQDWAPVLLQNAFTALNISPQARAETLGLQQFLALADYLNSNE